MAWHASLFWTCCSRSVSGPKWKQSAGSHAGSAGRTVRGVRLLLRSSEEKKASKVELNCDNSICGRNFTSHPWFFIQFHVIWRTYLNFCVSVAAKKYTNLKYLSQKGTIWTAWWRCSLGSSCLYTCLAIACYCYGKNKIPPRVAILVTSVTMDPKLWQFCFGWLVTNF